MRSWHVFRPRHRAAARLGCRHRKANFMTRELSPHSRVDAPSAADLVDGEAMLPVVRELLSAIPAGCTWLLPVTDAAGAVIDFRLAAAGAAAQDIGGRPGDARLGKTVAQLYPTIVGGPLWDLYHQV